MKIASSSVLLASANSHTISQTKRERLEYWNPNQRLVLEEQTSLEHGEAGQRVEISQQAKALAAGLAEQGIAFDADRDRPLQAEGWGKAKSQGKGPERSQGIAHQEAPEQCLACSPRLELMVTLVEKVFGMRVEIFDSAAFERDLEQAELPTQGESAAASEAPQRQGWGLRYQAESTQVERYESRFMAQGVVETADGEQISFETVLAMESERVEVRSFSLQAGDAELVDPLVLNFSGKSADLSADRINFDLDADGRAERIAFVASGSGFLVLDKNNNGQVDDGSELFGPQSGDGFAELSRYDEDGNDWIDENDSVYDKLSIWSRHNSVDSLQSLQAHDVGAIYLGSASTQQELLVGGESAGLLQATGVYLSEGGEVGTIQHVDLSATAPASEEEQAAQVDSPPLSIAQNDR